MANAEENAISKFYPGFQYFEPFRVTQGNNALCVKATIVVERNSTENTNTDLSGQPYRTVVSPLSEERSLNSPAMSREFHFQFQDHSC